MGENPVQKTASGPNKAEDNSRASNLGYTNFREANKSKYINIGQLKFTIDFKKNHKWKGLDTPVKDSNKMK